MRYIDLRWTKRYAVFRSQTLKPWIFLIYQKCMIPWLTGLYAKRSTSIIHFLQIQCVQKLTFFLCAINLRQTDFILFCKLIANVQLRSLVRISTKCLLRLLKHTERSLPVEYTKNLVASCLQRCQAIIDNVAQNWSNFWITKQCIFYNYNIVPINATCILVDENVIFGTHCKFFLCWNLCLVWQVSS